MNQWQKILTVGGGLYAITLLMSYANLVPNSLVAAVFKSTDAKLADCYTEIAHRYDLASPSTFTKTAVNVNSDNRLDYLVRIDDPALCGSSGCVYELCLSTDTHQVYRHSALGFSANTITPANGTTEGYRDLQLTSNQSNTILRWQNGQYRISY